MNDKKKISVAVASAVGLGAIIGAGIFVLSGTTIALAGANAILAFILVGIVVIILAAEYGELGSIMPYTSGASYSYVYQAFGSEMGFITGILFYLSLAVSISVIALGFGAYFTSLFSISINPIILAIIIILLLTLINLIGVKKTTKADSILVIIKILALIIFILFAIFIASKYSNINLSNFSVNKSQGTIQSLIEAMITIIFAYSGFQSISSITSKIDNGARGAAKSILIAVISSMIIYVLIVTALLLLAPATKYTISGDPLSIALLYSNSPLWIIIAVDIGALVATASAMIALLLSSSRILYQISKDKLLPRFFRKYNKNDDVAINGVLITAFIAIITLFAGNIFIITAISDFGLIFSYLMTSLALIHFRRRNIIGSVKTPLYPYLPIIVIFALLMFMYGMPSESLLIGVVIIISLLIIYYSLREVENKKVIRIHLFK
ncbi:MAG: APC family permease [Candidatus Marsarchaeota archaeon]|jgi:APA family basic amino acid/polyamine antiporter|nr:APC family permease [Candidatus Marsarchaeota archaeon]